MEIGESRHPIPKDQHQSCDLVMLAVKRTWMPGRSQLAAGACHAPAREVELLGNSSGAVLEGEVWRCHMWGVG